MSEEFDADPLTTTRSVCDMVRTTMGPFGTSKLVVERGGTVMTTSVGVEILDGIDVDNAYLTLLRETAADFESEHVDGTATLVALTGALLEQAAELEGMTDLDVVLSLDVSREELIDRLTGRRVCDDCSANYHVEFSPPEEAGVCDECGGDLIQRDDDNEGSVRNRLDVFDENTQPVIDHYRNDDDFVVIDGEQTPGEVWADIRAAVDAQIE